MDNAMRYAKLRGVIREKFGTQANFAKSMGMNPATLSTKLRGRTDWTCKEIELACTLIGVSVTDGVVYFLPNDVQDCTK